MRFFKTEDDLFNSDDYFIEIRHSELKRERWLYFFLGVVPTAIIAFTIFAR